MEKLKRLNYITTTGHNSILAPYSYNLYSILFLTTSQIWHYFCSVKSTIQDNIDKLKSYVFNRAKIITGWNVGMVKDRMVEWYINLWTFEYVQLLPNASAHVLILIAF